MKSNAHNLHTAQFQAPSSLPALHVSRSSNPLPVLINVLIRHAPPLDNTIFSLGCVMAELVTGVMPFEHLDNDVAIGRLHP